MEATPELNAALAKAQGEFKAITKSEKVNAGSYSYSYAPLDAVLAMCRPVLSENGLALVQLLEDTEHGPAIRTELRHSAGGVIGSSFPLPAPPPDANSQVRTAKQKAQELGALLTYVRRYAIVALLGIAAEDDTDLAHASETKPVGRKRQAAAPRSQPPPVPAAEPDPAFYAPEAITDTQRRRLYALFTEKNITEREKQLAFCTQALGRTVESSKEMGKAEATAVIRQLDEYDPENPQTYPFPPGY